jgi:hypothetical protein
MTRIMIAALVAMLTGCAARQAAQQSAEFNSAKEQCRTQIPAQIGNYVSLATCFNAARDRIFPPSAALALIEATHLSLAEKVDAGQMSLADARLQMANLEYGLNQEAQDRAAAAQAQRTQAAAAYMQGLAAMQAALPRPPTPTPPTHMSCYSGGGGYTNCSGN